jgi:putative nucleotidyltransferase with HDIG domain
VYISAVVVLAALLIAHGPLYPIAWRTLAVLALLFLLCESTSAALLPSRRASWSASEAATLASVVMLGPVGAAIVGITSAFILRRNMLIAQRVFNSAMYALSAYAAGRVFLLLGQHPGVPAPDSFPQIIGPFAAAAAAHVAVNICLIGGVLRLTGSRGQSSGRLRPKSVLTVGLPVLGYGMLGLLIAALWGLVGAFSAVLVLAPLFVARWAFGQHIAQQEAHEATMAALCQAVETKDFYTRGHSERVSKASVMIAREIGFNSERVEAIRHAGMLHDIGKLGVPTLVLQKSGALTEEEYAAIQLHPMRGLEIVREIGFLDEALAGIMHHHERMDGKGYPLGLTGDEIPEFARVIGVADAFDSMTSTRSYRGARPVEEAVTELRRWSGAQFDPVMVDAFIASLARDGWRSPEPVWPGDDQPAAAADHDDPTAPLRIIPNR